jgi:NADH-quinone oxidoreductase subunit L
MRRSRGLGDVYKRQGHIHLNQYILIITISFSLIIDGLAVLRIYSRLFNGPNYKSNHEIAYRSS